MKKIDCLKLKAGDVIILSKDEYFKICLHNGKTALRGIGIDTWDENFEGRVIKLSKRNIIEIAGGSIDLYTIDKNCIFHIPVQTFRYDISHKLKLL
jgi:hypothetical protein